MMKKAFNCMAVALSIISAFFAATVLNATPPDCVRLWNLCQEYCGGVPYMMVYPGGIVGVGCTNANNPPCSTEWGPWDCIN